jgi:hypothetical protein
LGLVLRQPFDESAFIGSQSLDVLLLLFDDVQQLLNRETPVACVSANLADIQDQVGNIHDTCHRHVHADRVDWLARGSIVTEGQRPIVPLQTEFGRGVFGTMGRRVVVRRQGANYDWVRLRDASS